MFMTNDGLKKILEDNELKKILEEKGFEDLGATSMLFSDKNASERYFALNTLLGVPLYGKDEKIIVELSKIEDSEDYFIKIYSKK
jgi:hypothetical protein